ncbi:MAG: hypothetical protein WBF13_02180 [Candidatus Zixiibacteriota bacterium]
MSARERCQNMGSVKKRIEKLEDEVAPHEYKEIKIINTIPDFLSDGTEKNEIIMRVPVKKRRKR